MRDLSAIWKLACRHKDPWQARPAADDVGGQDSPHVEEPGGREVQLHGSLEGPLRRGDWGNQSRDRRLLRYGLPGQDLVLL